MKRMMKIMLIMLFTCSWLVSCKSTLQVTSQFPAPLVNQLPLTVAVIYPEPFKSYKYIEQQEKRDDWEISVGQAQVALFNTVLNAMFRQVVEVKSLTSEQLAQVDLVIQPDLEQFQYNLPRETKVNMFEVWLKYHLTVYDPQGQLIADWLLSAYGKTPTAFFKSQETAMNESITIALRDFGASFSVKFQQIPEINQWLKTQKLTML